MADPNDFIGTVSVYQCLFPNCDQQAVDRQQLTRHIQTDHLNVNEDNRRGGGGKDMPRRRQRNILQTKDQNLPLPRASVGTQNRPRVAIDSQNQPGDIDTRNQPRAVVDTQNQPRAEVATQNQPRAAVATQNQPRAAVATQNQPRAAVATQNQPTAAVATQNQPRAAVATQNQPRAAVATQNQPRAAVATQNQPTAAVDAQNQNQTVIRLGNGFTAVAGGDMTDGEKATRYMHLLRVEGYEMCKCGMAPCLFCPIPERDIDNDFINHPPMRPSRRNHVKRRKMYKTTWSTLDNMGYFGLKEYKAVHMAHIESLETNREKEKARASLRRPLPQCAEEAIRRIFPNPPGLRYMNFKYY